MVLEPPGIPPGYTDGLVLTIFRDNVGMYVNIYIYILICVYTCKYIYLFIYLSLHGIWSEPRDTVLTEPGVRFAGRTIEAAAMRAPSRGGSQGASISAAAGCLRGWPWFSKRSDLWSLLVSGPFEGESITYWT